MNRAQWEAAAIAKREGWRDLRGELDRRNRERRNAKLAAEWQGEERREAERREGERRALSAALCDWTRRFDAARMGVGQ